jgi:uridine kinase
MKTLKAKFRRNGLPYTLLKRNEVVALYGIGGTYTDKILNYEVCKIYVRNDKYGIRESIPSNARFGRDPSRSFNDIESASEYFDELTTRLKKCQGMPKVVSGVQESETVVSEFSSA